MSDCVCGRCEDPEDAELSALRAEVEGLRKKLAEAEKEYDANLELMEGHLKSANARYDKIRAWLCDQKLDARYEAECDVPGCPKLWAEENAKLEAEVAKLRKVAEAAREYREAEKKYGGGADPIYASAVCQSGLALDAALAGLGEPTPEPPSEL